MRRILRFIFQLITLAVILVAMTALWITVDGLSDVTEKSDVALFAPDSGAATDSELDHVAKLHQDGEIPAIILCEQEEIGTHDRFVAARKYLVEHGVPGDAIIETSYLDTWDLGQKVAHEMKMHEDGSVMLVTNYYRMTRLKIALGHEGVSDIHKSHLGSVRGEDVIPIAWEVAALYNYVGKTFLLPAAKKIKDEAKVGVDKVKEDADTAKKKVDKGLDNLPK